MTLEDNPPNDSILTTVKASLGLPEAVMAYDPELLLHINTALSELGQLAVGIANELVVTDKTTQWSDLYSDPRLSMVKTYVSLQTRIYFDPPTPGYVLEAFKDRAKELAWRISVVAEEPSKSK